MSSAAPMCAATTRRYVDEPRHDETPRDVHSPPRRLGGEIADRVDASRPDADVRSLPRRRQQARGQHEIELRHGMGRRHGQRIREPGVACRRAP